MRLSPRCITGIPSRIHRCHQLYRIRILVENYFPNYRATCSLCVGRSCSAIAAQCLFLLRRQGLICYRIAMILSALRMMETGAIGSDIICLDEEFDSALAISKVLAVHMAKIFEELSSQDNKKIAAIVNTNKRQRFLDELPPEFDCQDYIEAGKRSGTTEGTAGKWIRAFCKDDGPLEKIEHGLYRKK